MKSLSMWPFYYCDSVDNLVIFCLFYFSVIIRFISILSRWTAWSEAFLKLNDFLVCSSPQEASLDFRYHLSQQTFQLTANQHLTIASLCNIIALKHHHILDISCTITIPLIREATYRMLDTEVQLVQRGPQELQLWVVSQSRPRKSLWKRCPR